MKVKTFLLLVKQTFLLANFCPECGGNLKFDSITKNYICTNCGIFTSREKIDEIRDKAFAESHKNKNNQHDDYLEWWHSSKKDKNKN